jgi:hypothetical protein
MCTGNLIKNLSSYNKLYPKRYTERSNKKKIRVGENGGLNQSKHQNPGNAILFLFDRTLEE